MSPAENTRKVVAKVAERHGLTYADIIASDRREHVVRVRQEVWFTLRTERSLTYPAIGRVTGHDHTTALHGVKRYCEREGIDYQRSCSDLRYPHLLRPETFAEYGRAMGVGA